MRVARCCSIRRCDLQEIGDVLGPRRVIERPPVGTTPDGEGLDVHGYVADLAAGGVEFSDVAIDRAAR